MKHINIILAGILMIGITQSCKKDLIKANTNPNALNDTRPEFLFTSATMNYLKQNRDDYTAKYATTMTYMQYLVADAATSEGLGAPYNNPNNTSLTDFRNPSYPLYGRFYEAYGRDLARVIQKIDGMTDETLRNGYIELKAISQILLTYNAWRVVDVYGAMAYKEAFDLTYPAPAYDYDYDLYKLFDTQIKDAVTVLKNNSIVQKPYAANDFYYGGVKANWIKFANTLRIKIAQRYEKRDAQNLSVILADIASNFGADIISSNTTSFGYNHPQDFEGNPDELNRIVTQYVAAYPFVEYLKSVQDPRIVFMVRENDFGTNYGRYNTVKASGDAKAQADLNRPEVLASRFQGKHVFPASVSADYGWWGTAKNQTFTYSQGSGTATTTLSFQSNLQSRLFVKNGAYRANDVALHTDEPVAAVTTLKTRTQIMGYAEVCFMMAEIAAKGGNSFGRSAAQWYADGVTASFDDYKARAVAAAVPNASGVTLGSLLTRIPYTGLSSIYSQAWVNFLLQPEESWAMWKRTGYPQFADFRVGQISKIGDGSGIAYLENLWNGTVNLTIPRRAVLPTAIPQNSQNFQKALTDMKSKDASYGTDPLDTRGRIWWDMQ
jgi:hypothetical protein